MEKSKSLSQSRGEATSFGFKRAKPPDRTPLPSVAASVTKETIEPILMPTLSKHGTPKVGRAKKESSSVNRFGYRPSTALSNKVADLQSESRLDKDVKEPRAASAPAIKLTAGRSLSESRCKRSTPMSPAGESQVVGKFTLHSSQLPRPQCPVRVQASSGSLHVDKWAKTVANNQTASMVHASVPGTVSKFGFRGSKLSNGDPMRLEIEHLEESPSVTNKFRTSIQKRPNEIVFSNTRNKTFNLENLQDSRREVRRMDPIEHVAERRPNGALSSMQNSPCNNLSHSMQYSIISNDSQGEEKHHRDLESSEKDTLRSNGECASDEMWGHGEAMALEEDITCLEEIDQSPECMNPPLRSVLLKIEDPTFASLAALSKSGMLEDEKSPDSPASPDLSCGSPPSVEPLPPPPLVLKADSPVSPTHGSSSFSSDARDRDFLIDDEIADQPGLIFNSAQTHEHKLSSTTSQTIATLAGQVSKVLANFHESPLKGKDRLTTTSLGTLSPCESLASDDLMVDFDRSETSNLEDLNDVEDSVLRSELEMQSSQVMKEWNSLLSAHPGLSNGMQASRQLRSRMSSLSSGGPQDSPKSHHSSLSSPHHHKMNRLGTMSPSDDLSSDSGIRVDRGTYQNMFQEVVNIKTMLLRLKRVLQDSETMDPFDKSNKSGLYCGLASSEAGEDSPHQLADLRRQVVLLQHQMVEKDRLIQRLEETLSRVNDLRPKAVEERAKVNAATQTDRVRPLSTGPILLQTSCDDSPRTFVSYSTEVARAHTGRTVKKNRFVKERDIRSGADGVKYISSIQHLSQEKVS